VGYVGIATALRELGELESAECGFAQAAGLFPDDPWAAHNYASIAAAAGNWPEALCRWEAMQKSFPNHASAYGGAVEALCMLGRTDEADRVLTEAIERFPSDYWIVTGHARLAAQASRWDEAVRRWEIVLQQFPQDRRCRVEKTEALLHAGRLAEAADFVKIAIERFPAEPIFISLAFTVAARTRAAARVASQASRAQIVSELARIRTLVGQNPTNLLRTIYSDLLSLDPAPARVAEPLRHLLAILRELVPDNSLECIQLCEDLSLNDIERLCVLSATLSLAPQNTIWLHYNLADVLNRLLLSGQAIARAPCLLHSFLTLSDSRGGQHSEALPRWILARELTEFAPHDAIREGLASVMLGNSVQSQTMQAAAKRLNLLPDGIMLPPAPDLLHLKTIAQACGLSMLKDIHPVRRAQASAINEQIAFEAETRTLPVPKGDSHHYVFRDAGLPLELPAIRVYAIPFGTVSLDISQPGRTQLYVFDSNNVCISDLSVGATPFIEERRIEVEGTLGILDDVFSGQMNICHFLLDHLTRVEVYRKTRGNDIRFLLSGRFRYYDEIIQLTGLETSLIRTEAERVSARAELLLVSSNISESFHHPAHLCAEWALDFLRTRLPKAPSQEGDRKIFISRTDARGRRLLNERDLSGLLRDRGFELVTLSGRSVREQIELFSSASHIIGTHGAGLTNQLFSPSGTRVLELLPPLVATGDYWILSSRLGHAYSCLIAEDPEYPRPDYGTWDHRPEYGRRDIIVPAERLMKAIDAMDD
jgi:tetratricopeptide (TPR) repeat protein